MPWAVEEGVSEGTRQRWTRQLGRPESGAFRALSLTYLRNGAYYHDLAGTSHTVTCRRPGNARFRAGNPVVSGALVGRGVMLTRHRGTAEGYIG